jgi:cholesterol transport system auxiliary component
VIRSSIKLAVAAAAAVTVAGCALLSSPDPVQTYRFGGPAAASAIAEGQAGLREVNLRRVQFPESVEGDKLLGVTGTETAYIKGARWVSPASDLYMESLANAFSAQATRVRLIGPRELIRGGRELDIDVRAFEARYDAPEAVPVVVVTARARMLALPDRTVAAERTFTVEQPASANRVSAIVEAFDIATRDMNAQIVAWTDANAG